MLLSGRLDVSAEEHRSAQSDAIAAGDQAAGAQRHDEDNGNSCSKKW